MILTDMKMTAMEKSIYMERYVNNGSPSGFTFSNNTSVGTRFFDDVKTIELSAFEFSDDDTAFEIGEKKDAFFPRNILLVHPDLSKHISENSSAILKRYVRAVPMGSGRTVYIPENDMFVKLHYNNLIGRISRCITINNSSHAIAVNKILEQYLLKHKGLYFFPEVYAKGFRLNDNSSIGMLLRQNKIKPILNEEYCAIPAFSLFSCDSKNPNDAPILWQLLDKCSYSKEEYVLTKLLFPVVSLYFELLINQGLQIEAHAQNICYIYTEDILGVAIRDFESVDKDLGIEKNNNLFNSEYKCISPKSIDYQKRHSFMFDFKLGEYLITPIIKSAAMYGCSEIRLVVAIKNFSKQYLNQLPIDFFPRDKWYSFPNELIDRSTSKRPYIENDNPKYR